MLDRTQGLALCMAHQSRAVFGFYQPFRHGGRLSFWVRFLSSTVIAVCSASVV